MRSTDSIKCITCCVSDGVRVSEGDNRGEELSRAGGHRSAVPCRQRTSHVTSLYQTSLHCQRKSLNVTLELTLLPFAHTSRTSETIMRKKRIHSAVTSSMHQSSEERDWQLCRDQEDITQSKRAEKLLAFLTSLSHWTRDRFKPRDRPGFQRSASALRLLKSEA